MDDLSYNIYNTRVSVGGVVFKFVRNGKFYHIYCINIKLDDIKHGVQTKRVKRLKSLQGCHDWAQRFGVLDDQTKISILVNAGLRLDINGKIIEASHDYTALLLQYFRVDRVTMKRDKEVFKKIFTSLSYEKAKHIKEMYEGGKHKYIIRPTARKYAMLTQTQMHEFAHVLTTITPIVKGIQQANYTSKNKIGNSARFHKQHR